ncbi:hypothetical protein [Tenggerimyces flavus]|uniref:Uncharacterized protein n=1 Tax=Tenggerimyces flavus TaxID=1708749 RepID=A0ABV7YCW7_9ACTN|nr:hypothetical protein [Tenggerimyces flavus]MBM7788868.1 hypothetical protein [Tenggerimyces flavus]
MSSVVSPEPAPEPKPERRPTMWEQAGALQVGDFCDLCVTNEIAQRKIRTYTGWQACPRCDYVRPLPPLPPLTESYA